jgi:RNA polymerase sigma factor (sigma-70 family)
MALKKTSLEIQRAITIFRDYKFPRGIGEAEKREMALPSFRARYISPQTGELAEPDDFFGLRGIEYRMISALNRRRKTDFIKWHELYIPAKNQIATKHLPLVAYCIKNTGLDLDESLSNANGTLLRAIDRFNPFKGFRFSTYAVSAIKMELNRYMKKHMRHREKFSTTLEETTAETYVSVARDDKDLLIEQMDRIIWGTDLTPNEISTLKKRLLTSGKPQTLRSVGEELGFSKERIRQMQNSALRKLREEVESTLRDFEGD